MLLAPKLQIKNGPNGHQFDNSNMQKASLKFISTKSGQPNIDYCHTASSWNKRAIFFVIQILVFHESRQDGIKLCQALENPVQELFFWQIQKQFRLHASDNQKCYHKENQNKQPTKLPKMLTMQSILKRYWNLTLSMLITCIVTTYISRRTKKKQQSNNSDQW